MPSLTAKGPVLVHFFDCSQVNSVRTLPYLVEWDRRYREAGLSTIGVQSPRFPFGADPVNVAAGLGDLGVGVPGARAGARGWFQFGEGEAQATEEAIQEELRELDALRTLPAPMAPLRATDEPGARVIPPTPEEFPGGSWEQPWIAGADGEDLALDYQAGGAYATVAGGGGGELRGESAGGCPTPPAAPAPGLPPPAEHPRHEAHNLVLRPAPGVK